MRVHLGVGVFAYGTGIHENHVCGFPVFGHDIPFAHEQGSNELGVVLVHLTTERFDVHLAAVTGLNIHDSVPSISFIINRPTAQRSEAPVIVTSWV